MSGHSIITSQDDLSNSLANAFGTALVGLRPEPASSLGHPATITFAGQPANEACALCHASAVQAMEGNCNEGSDLNGIGHDVENLDQYHLDRRRRAGLIGRPQLNSGGHVAPGTGTSGTMNPSPESKAACRGSGDIPPSQFIDPRIAQANLRPVKDILHDLMDAFDRLSEEVENSLTVRDQMDARWNANREARP